MDPQYVAVTFRPGDKRTYTHVNEGERVAVGDWVKVPDKSGDGWNRVQVAAIVDKPRFECKPILGKLDGDSIDAKLAQAAPPAPPPPPADLFNTGA